jgi:hypothetical protein
MWPGRGSTFGHRVSASLTALALGASTTVGCDYFKIFGTPGYRNSLQTYSREYNHTGQWKREPHCPSSLLATLAVGAAYDKRVLTCNHSPRPHLLPHSASSLAITLRVLTCYLTPRPHLLPLSASSLATSLRVLTCYLTPRPHLQSLSASSLVTSLRVLTCNHSPRPHLQPHWTTETLTALVIGRENDTGSRGRLIVIIVAIYRYDRATPPARPGTDLQ